MKKLSVDQALLKAKSHGKKGEIEEAQNLYRAVLQAFPNNKRLNLLLAKFISYYSLILKNILKSF